MEKVSRLLGDAGRQALRHGLWQ